MFELYTVLCIFVRTILASGPKEFPADFRFGAATSAFQIEGAWNISGKGPSIWDDYVHENLDKITDHQTADVSAFSYGLFREDIAALKYMGMDFYRFSMSWPRILPTGDISTVNRDGIAYYNRLINELLDNDIQPMVTMFHWDLPSELSKIGGFTSSQIVDYFTAYANLLFQEFGDRVKYWITFNEPAIFCWFGYGLDMHAPALNSSGVGEYLCGHNVLKAHAAVYHSYKKCYYKRYNGQIGISSSASFYFSETNDRSVVDRSMQFMLGWFAGPIFSKRGDYPAVMKKDIAINSKREGRIRSRLPEFTLKEICEIRGSADFLGANYYTARYVTRPGSSSMLNGVPLRNPSYERDLDVTQYVDPEWKVAASFFIYSVPEGLRGALGWIKDEYNNPSVFITENGWSDRGGLDDDDRIEYLHGHLENVREALLTDKCNVKGYTVWSLIDNYEWGSGYTEKFGLFRVDMNDPRRKRTKKKSADFMRLVVHTHKIPVL